MVELNTRMNSRKQNSEEFKIPLNPKTYISLFSSAGVGCYGFKLEGFHCIATVELIERRLQIQRFNKKCALDSGYICGDMTLPETHNLIHAELDKWKKQYHADLDVVIATPPCQGMSVANHKKTDAEKEQKRNSLVVESIKTVMDLKPKFFVFENVRAFLTSACTDLDNKIKSIREAIDEHLSSDYKILYKVINFKEYGNGSSRTRTLVIGVRNDLKETVPFELFPDRYPERTLRQVIGHLPALKKMGEILPTDIYHNFRKYNPSMESWVADIKEGQSAFDNKDDAKKPHTIKDGKIVVNVQKNGYKYTRQYWDKVAPCVHTRNDIMASQNTVHPSDNRVFSVRELMLMMSIPDSFKWTEKSFEELNAMPLKEKEKFIKQNDINIRQTIGEAVPTIIFRQIASKIKRVLDTPPLTEKGIKELIEKNNLTDRESLVRFVRDSNYTFPTLSKIAELANSERLNTAAFYTAQNICYDMVDRLPDPSLFGDKETLYILEPSVGLGNFLPAIIYKYADSTLNIVIDVVDIDGNSLLLLRELLQKFSVPSNVQINYINDDFLLHEFDRHYDIIVGNPPYMKLTGKSALLASYKSKVRNQETNNLFAFFIEVALRLGDFICLVVPKSLINAPEFNITRKVLSGFEISSIIDFGEKAFKGVKIETVSFVVNTLGIIDNTTVISYITNHTTIQKQCYITDVKFPYWLIYRNKDFDTVAKKMSFNIFNAFRDRKITKSQTKPAGKYRVLKSRNIANNEIIDIAGYDCYMDDISDLAVAKYLNQECYLVPNLTYYPRACMLPPETITDGSVAILTLKDNKVKITKEDLAYYATDEFSKFYTIARNRGTRSLNIDNNSVFFFGKLKTE